MAQLMNQHSPYYAHIDKSFSIVTSVTFELKMTSIGFGPKIHLRGAKAKHSYMVALGPPTFPSGKLMFVGNLLNIRPKVTLDFQWKNTQQWPFGFDVAMLSAYSHYKTVTSF